MTFELTDSTLTSNMRKLGISEDNMTIQSRYFMCFSSTSFTSGIWKLINSLEIKLTKIQKNGVVEPLQNIIFVNDISNKINKKTEEVKEEVIKLWI